MGHMPHRLRPMPPPPLKNIMDPLAPFFQFINRALNNSNSTNLIHIVLTIYIAVY